MFSVFAAAAAISRSFQSHPLPRSPQKENAEPSGPAASAEPALLSCASLGSPSVFGPVTVEGDGDTWVGWQEGRATREEFRPAPPPPLTWYLPTPPPRGSGSFSVELKERRGSGEGPAEGAGGRWGRGGHAARPVPAESRACVAANRRAALSWERGGCGERRTETGDVFKPGLRGVRGGCSGDEDNDSDGNTEALVQGVNPPTPIVPWVREGEGGVATGEEEGGARFRAPSPALGRRPLSSALLPSPLSRAR